MITGTLTDATTYYYGPGTSKYLSGGMLAPGTQVEVLWREQDEGSWYYVSVGTTRRCYVPGNSVSLSGGYPSLYVTNLQARKVGQSSSSRLGPSLYYNPAGILATGTKVHFLYNKKEGDYAMVQVTDQDTGKFKRVWFEHMKLGKYSGPVNHDYSTGTYNNIVLHIIRTHARNIRLFDQTSTAAGRKPLHNSGYFGINGGWFDLGTPFDILNIAMYNGNNVGNGEYGGRVNTVGSGAIGWNGDTNSLSFFTNAASCDSIPFSAQANSWVQGGFHLWLGNSNWQTQFVNQPSGSSFINGNAYRAAMIANKSTNNVYLVVTNQSVSVSAFRGAIQSYMGITDGSQSNANIQALLLDGGLSSQLRAKDSNGAIKEIYMESGGAARSLAQIAVLKYET